MKTICTILIVLASCILYINGKPMSSSERNEMIEAVVMACKAGEGASDDDMTAFFKHQLPTTQEGKCLHACVMDKMGITVNGEYNLEGAINAAKQNANGEKKIEIGIELAKACAHVKASDRCELSAKLIQCTTEAVSKYGINFNEMRE